MTNGGNANSLAKELLIKVCSRFLDNQVFLTPALESFFWSQSFKKASLMS